METSKELRERLDTFIGVTPETEYGIGLFDMQLRLEQIIQLARIADSLEKIETEGIFTYPRDFEEEPEE